MRTVEEIQAEIIKNHEFINQKAKEALGYSEQIIRNLENQLEEAEFTIMTLQRAIEAMKQ